MIRAKDQLGTAKPLYHLEPEILLRPKALPVSPQAKLYGPHIS